MFRGAPHVRLTFLDARGQVPGKASLNWWNASAIKRARTPDEAYIPLHVDDQPAAARVFGSTARGTQFLAVFHDGTTMKMLLQGNHDGHAKQINSQGDTQLFGRWILRQILNHPQRQLITVADLNRYGRIAIDFYRIGTDPGTNLPIVYGDFS
jgi:hypothetical protein